MSVALDPEQQKEVRRILNRRVPGVEVWVFGSRATGRAKQFSDLDLALSSGRPLPKERLWELRESFSESDLPFRVDVIDLASVSDEFKRVVERNHVVLQN